MATLNWLPAASRIRRLLAVGAIATSNIHKCMHGLEQSMCIATEYKRHGKFFDCYNDVDDTELAEEKSSTKPRPHVTAVRVVPNQTFEAEHITKTELLTTGESADVEESLEEQPIESQFGPIGSQSHRYVSQHMGGPLRKHIPDEPSYFYLLTTYISYMILTAFGHVRDFFGKQFKPEKYKDYKPRDGYAALNSDYDNFYFRRLKKRMDDCFGRPCE
jgi:serine palmitoyltransferase